MRPAGELTHIPLATGVLLHLHRVPLYKTVRIDICIGEQLRQGRNSHLALISRLLERGTRNLPDLQSLNRFIDELYGAHYYAAVDKLGEYQFIHLCLELIDEKYLANADKGVFTRALFFLREILLAPAGDGRQFKPDYLSQEKYFLARQIFDSFNDKTEYAQQRCIEEMCRGESIALSAFGDPAYFDAVDAVQLLDFHRGLLESNRIDVFVSGDFDPEYMQAIFGDFINWERRKPDSVVQPRIKPFLGPAREIFEFHELQQAQMVLGYRTSILYGMENYPALILLNLVLGGDGQSRLFKHLREEESLCYYAASHVEALSGLLFVVAAIESATYHRAKTIIERQIESLRRGYIENYEIESARSLLQARLLGLAEDREDFFRFQLREELIGGGQSPEKLWRSVERVGIDDLVRVANHLKADTTYLLHGGVGAKIAI